jgi:hypothetical protein
MISKHDVIAFPPHLRLTFGLRSRMLNNVIPGLLLPVTSQSRWLIAD